MEEGITPIYSPIFLFFQMLGIKYPQPKFSAGLALAGSVHDSKEDSARTPTGVGFRRQLQLPVSSVWTLTGADFAPDFNCRRTPP